ncbi:ACP S-malonyltransferase [Luteithermobacter gelatinilyticus]|uniref:ACP S-malonyltransferase n=1 Tax=Luteithermobacter gelatinilyticus TaxID=2582913 RepID=UPI00110664B5|nr:ACP S-malonyltransferase [Luteithermobacter gelatinilyticus]
MTRAFTFPGQGSQTVGMGRELAENMPVAAQVFEEVDDALSEHLSRVMFEGPQEDLTLTHNAQPALMAVSIAVIRVLEKDFDVPLATAAAYVAGHSLGEYSALTAAGALTLSDAAKLLRLRGEAMQRAVPVGEGAMAAILGLEMADVEAVVKEAVQDGEVCTAANDNANGQVVISGTKAAVERAIPLAKEKGAMKGVLLPVSAPFHCALMQPAAEEMEAALKETAIQAPVVPVIANVTAAPENDPEVIRRLLVEQVTGRVRWRESVLKMAELGVDSFVEAGAGKVLTGLVRRIDRSLTGLSLQTPTDIEAFATSLKS